MFQDDQALNHYAPRASRPPPDVPAPGPPPPSLAHELKPPKPRLGALLAIFGVVVGLALIAIMFLLLLALSGKARAHDCWPSQCCSGQDCREVQLHDVDITPYGFFVKESGEVIAFADERVKKTPAHCGAIYGRCSEGGRADGKTICIYIPNWTN